MKRIFKYIILGLLIILLGFSYFRHDFGVLKSNIEKDARTEHKINSNWKVAKSTTDKLSTMIFYSKDFNDYTIAVYINKGFPFGYVFYYGGSSNVENEGVLEYDVKGIAEKAYISMNKQKINKVQFNTEKVVETINIDSTKPFSIIIPSKATNIKFYNKNGVVS